MKNLFLVDGASGTGKSDLLEFVSSYRSEQVAQFLKKRTTRQKRSYEDSETFLLDLEFISEDEFRALGLDYTYRYGGHNYGFGRRELEQSLQNSDNVFVIVRDTHLIRQISADYNYLNVVPLFMYTDESLLRDRLQKQGLHLEDIEARITRSKRAIDDYFTHSDVYREIIINNSTEERFHSLITRMLDKYSVSPKIDPHMVGVMMSFDTSKPLLYDYFHAMERAVTSISPELFCRRVDKLPGSPKISRASMSLLESARALIVDLTGNKQNVYYELGVAHARHKTCVITAAKGTKPFFYASEHKITFYESATDLEAKLKTELSAVLRRRAD